MSGINRSTGDTRATAAPKAVTRKTEYYAISY